MIVRSVRVFPEGYNNETQVVATVLSYDGTFPLEILASLGASAAMHISDLPFNGPTAAVQVGRINKQFIANPTPAQLEESDMDITIAGTRNGILMVEGEAKFISESEALEALKFGHKSLGVVFDAQDELRQKTGSKVKRVFTPAAIDAGFKKQVEDFLTPKIKAALSIQEKQKRYETAGAAVKEAAAKFVQTASEADQPKMKKQLDFLAEGVKYNVARFMILDDKIRIDGRNTTTVRPILCEAAILPRAHGSALFTRGETQVLGTVTLGTGDDEQMIDSLSGMLKRKFLLHYNFPPFSVGETGRMGGQSRRELGHGNFGRARVETNFA